MSFIERERKRIKRRSRVSEMVYGSQDGVTTSVGVVCSLFAATHSSSAVLVAGISAALAGMFSMAAGSYLSTTAKADLDRSEIARERKKIRGEPDNELRELRKIYERHGMSKKMASEAATAVSRKPRKVLPVMAQAELGIDARPRHNPIADAMVTAGSYLAAACLPLLPYAVLPVATAFLLAVVFAVCVLFAIGMIKGALTDSHRIRSGIETLVLGVLAAGLGFAVGTLIPKSLALHTQGKEASGFLARPFDLGERLA